MNGKWTKMKMSGEIVVGLIAYVGLVCGFPIGSHLSTGLTGNIPPSIQRLPSPSIRYVPSYPAEAINHHGNLNKQVLSNINYHGFQFGNVANTFGDHGSKLTHSYDFNNPFKSGYHGNSPSHIVASLSNGKHDNRHIDNPEPQHFLDSFGDIYFGNKPDENKKKTENKNKDENKEVPETDYKHTQKYDPNNIRYERYIRNEDGSVTYEMKVHKYDETSHDEKDNYPSPHHKALKSF